MTELVKQHLIDPEICIRCHTCEEACPIGAITHDDVNVVVDAEKCNFCRNCTFPHLSLIHISEPTRPY